MPERALDSWFWITVFSVVLIVTVPFLVVWGILYLPPVWAFVATISIIVLWGVAAGYKDWVVSKRRQSEQEAKEASEEKPEQA